MKAPCAALGLALVFSSASVAAQPVPGQPEPPPAPPEPEPQPAQPAPAQPAPARPEPAQPDPARPEPAQSEPAQSEPGTAPPPAGPAPVPHTAAATTEEGDPLHGLTRAWDDTGVDVRTLLRWTAGPMFVAPVLLVMGYATPYAGEDSFFQSGDIAEQGGFRLRRSRFGLHSGYDDLAEIRVSVDVRSDEDAPVRIHDAFLGFMPFEWARLHVGAQAVPFSRTQLIRSGRGALMERPLGNRAMAPGQQLGMVVSGEWFNAALGYRLGLFNGFQRTNLFYQGFIQNASPVGNRFDGLGYVARITSEPLGPMPGTGADEDQGPLRFAVGANYLYNDGGARDVHSAGGDAHLMWRGLHVLGEALWARTIPETDPSIAGAVPLEVTSFTFSGEAGYMILPRRLGIAARFEWLEPNDKQDDESDNWLVTGGATVHLVDQLLKGQLEYTHRQEVNGVQLKNDSVTFNLQGQLDPARPRGNERGIGK